MLLTEQSVLRLQVNDDDPFLATGLELIWTNRLVNTGTSVTSVRAALLLHTISLPFLLPFCIYFCSIGLIFATPLGWPSRAFVIIN